MDFDDQIINQLTGKAKCVYDKLQKLSGGFRNAIKKFDGDFPGMLDYYTRYGNNINSNWQHQQMAAHYRQTIADVLKDFDNNQHSNQFYMDLAWEGLNHSNIVAWKDAISQAERTRINNSIASYIAQNKNQTCK